MREQCVYRCEVCQTTVEALELYGPELVCCGRVMERVREKCEDYGHDVHRPIVRQTDRGFRVSVGRQGHPMEEDHYIQWIEVLTETGCYREYLHPDQPPQAYFDIHPQQSVTVRAFCSLHGLWKAYSHSCCERYQAEEVGVRA